MQLGSTLHGKTGNGKANKLPKVLVEKSICVYTQHRSMDRTCWLSMLTSLLLTSYLAKKNIDLMMRKLQLLVFLLIILVHFKMFLD